MVFQVKENKIPGGKYRKLRRKKGIVLKKHLIWCKTGATQVKEN